MPPGMTWTRRKRLLMRGKKVLWMLPETATRKKLWGRLPAALIGLLLFAHLVRRAGPATILHGIASVGWGLVLVIALAGLALAVRTWAWGLAPVHARTPASSRRAV